jgi:hypothetical protein
MAPRKKTGETEDDDDPKSTPKLFNIANLGMGYYDKFCKVVQVTDVSLKLVGSAFSPAYGLKGNVWLVKYHKSKNKEIRRLFMPKKIQKDPGEFEHFLDRQSGEDSNFRIRSRILWQDFVRSEEDRLHESGKQIRFTIAEATGMIGYFLSAFINHLCYYRIAR